MTTKNKSVVSWLWQKDEKSWIPYDENTSDTLELSFTENIKTINLEHSDFDLSLMCQKKDDCVRPIKRVTSKQHVFDISFMSLQCMKLVPEGFASRRSEWISSMNRDIVKEIPEKLLGIVGVTINRGLFIVFSNDEISRLAAYVEDYCLHVYSLNVKKLFAKLKCLYGIVYNVYRDVIQKMGNIFKVVGDVLFSLDESDTDSLEEALNTLQLKLKGIPDNELEFFKIELEKTVSELDGVLIALVSNANGQKNDFISKHDNILNKARLEYEEAHFKYCSSLTNVSKENKDRDLGISFLKEDINSLQQYISHLQKIQVQCKDNAKQKSIQKDIFAAQKELINLIQNIPTDLDPAFDQQKLQEIQDKYDSAKKTFDSTQEMISKKLETYHRCHEEYITRSQKIYNLGSFMVAISSSLCLIKEYKTEICNLISYKEITLNRVLSILRPLFEAYLEEEVHTNLSVLHILEPIVEKYFNIIYQNTTYNNTLKSNNPAPPPAPIPTYQPPLHYHL